MANEQIDVGTVANDNTGDPIRDAFIKVNNNSDLSDLSGLIDSNIVTPGLEDTPTTVNLNGLTVFDDDIDFTLKANGSGIIILDTTVTRLVTTLFTQANSTGVDGDILGDVTFDVNWIYVAVKDWDNNIDTWKRAALATF